jgi:hypothetical protein
MCAIPVKQSTPEQLYFLAEVLFDGLEMENFKIAANKHKAALVWKVRFMLVLHTRPESFNPEL